MFKKPTQKQQPPPVKHTNLGRDMQINYDVSPHSSYLCDVILHSPQQFLSQTGLSFIGLFNDAHNTLSVVAFCWCCTCGYKRRPRGIKPRQTTCQTGTETYDLVCVICLHRA